MKRHGNRIQCLEGCGRWVLKNKPICRKCKKRTHLRFNKAELKERRAKAVKRRGKK